MVSLVEQGWADQNEVARAFGYAARTVRRQQPRVEDGGWAALGQGNGYPRGRARRATARTQGVQELRKPGCFTREIARRLGVSPKAIRKLLRRWGCKDSAPVQPERALNAAGPGDPSLSAVCSTAVAPATLDTDPSERWNDRLMAYWGLLDDAAPRFGSRTGVARAGVLLALPPLIHSGVFACAQTIYGSLGPAFYGLRPSLLTRLLMAPGRIKRPEGLKEHSPPALGRVLGLDRAPEVKTLRRKRARWAAAGKAAQFSVRPWPKSGWPCAAPPWAACRWTARSALTTAGTACPRPTWRRGAGRCPPPPTTG